LEETNVGTIEKHAILDERIVPKSKENSEKRGNPDKNKTINYSTQRKIN